MKEDIPLLSKHSRIVIFSCFMFMNLFMVFVRIKRINVKIFLHFNDRGNLTNCSLVKREEYFKLRDLS